MGFYNIEKKDNTFRIMGNTNKKQRKIHLWVIENNWVPNIMNSNHICQNGERTENEKV